MCEQRASACLLARGDEAIVLGRVFADRLAAQGLLMAHIPRRRQLAEGARHHVLRHGRRPHRLHQRSEEHTSELQSRLHLVCRLLLEKKKTKTQTMSPPKHT